MNKSLLFALVIGFILLAGIIVYIDMQFLLPGEEMPLPDVNEMILEQSRQPIGNIDAFFNTKEIIKQRGRIQKNVTANILSGGQNPFLTPDEIFSLKYGKNNIADKNILEQEMLDKNENDQNFEHDIPFHLSMIMVGQTRKIALVNQQFIAVGDDIEGFIVKKISKKSVVFVNKEEQKEILLEPDSVPLVHRLSTNPIDSDLGRKNENTRVKGDKKQAENIKHRLETILKMYDQNLN